MRCGVAGTKATENSRARPSSVRWKHRSFGTVSSNTSRNIESNAYDAETGHSQAKVFVPNSNLFTPPHQKGAPQIKWEGLIASAFTTPRPSGELAPDKAPYKVELEDVLINAGVSLP
jgi:hypothetical protein